MTCGRKLPRSSRSTWPVNALPVTPIVSRLSVSLFSPTNNVANRIRCRTQSQKEGRRRRGLRHREIHRARSDILLQAGVMFIESGSWRRAWRVDGGLFFAAEWRGLSAHVVMGTTCLRSTRGHGTDGRSSGALLRQRQLHHSSGTQLSQGHRHGSLPSSRRRRPPQSGRQQRTQRSAGLYPPPESTAPPRIATLGTDVECRIRREVEFGRLGQKATESSRLRLPSLDALRRSTPCGSR